MGTIGFAMIKLLDVLSFIILIRCIMTWIPGGYQSKLYDVLYRLTSPIEEPIRSAVYKFSNGPIDFSPLIALFLIRFAQRAIVMIAY